MPKPTKIPILKYGARWPHDAHPLEIEFACIAALGQWEDGRGKKCGYGLPFHVKAAMKILWPEMYWHRWTEMEVDEFLKSPGRTGIFGPSNAQKSFVFSRAALTMWYARPNGTTVLISSTTLDALRRRIWDYVVSSDKDARSQFKWLPGSLIESKLMLLADPSAEEGRSFKNGIVGVACKKGGQWQGLEEYVGVKNSVVILICDECQFMPIGFLDSLANLESNDPCYSALMGNLPDVHCSLAQACEPKNGWDSLPPTKVSRAYETKWKNGRAIQLIAVDSPNLDYPEGQEPYKGLIGRRYIEQCRYNYGEGTAKFNMFASGQVPDASMSATVFTKAQAKRCNVLENVTWGHRPVVRGYCLDAAYSGVGGDRTPGCPFVFGQDNHNQWRIWFGPRKIYIGSQTGKQTHAEAIAEQCKVECEAHGIPPEHMFYDGTGRSELTIAFARIWSAKVVPIEFGGPATERPSFTGEKHLDDRDGKKAGERKTCRELYDRFVSELWFAWAFGIISDQVRGLDEEIIEEGCQRKWELVRGSKQCVETKVDMKERGLRSPDLCFVAGTMVSTPNGDRKIETLQSGDLVSTPFGTTRIFSRIQLDAPEILSVKLSDGRTLSGTPDHKVFTWDMGWIKMDTLSLTNELESVKSLPIWKLRNALFTKAEHTSFKALVDIIKTETGRVAWTGFYTDAFGLRSTVQFLKDIVSTTKTETGQIIRCLICAFKNTVNTHVTMLVSDSKTQSSGSGFSTQELRLLSFGTSLKLAGCGILKTQKEYGKIRFQRIIGARFAEVIFRASTRSALSSVQIHADQSGPEKNTGLRRIARFAVSFLRRISSMLPSTVRVIVRQSPLQGSRKVYSLSLERHNAYYAEGVLVANCDMAVCGIEGARRLGFPLGKDAIPSVKKTNVWLSHMYEEQFERIKKDELEAA